MSKAAVAVTAALTIALAGSIALHPTVTSNDGALIINTTISSAVIDGDGYALSVNPDTHHNYQLNIGATGVTVTTYQH
jgi:hypothetical protein